MVWIVLADILADPFNRRANRRSGLSDRRRYYCHCLYIEQLSFVITMSMQQFVVPQFIDVEDKIFGPITTRQFLVLLAAGLMIFIAYRYADTALFIAIAVIVGGAALSFSFVRVNGQVFHLFLLNIIQTMKRPSLRIWNKTYSNKELEFFRKSNESPDVIEMVAVKTVRKQHIRDLSLVVNTGGYYRPEDHM